jgi:hypothetical protein
MRKGTKVYVREPFGKTKEGQVIGVGEQIKVRAYGTGEVIEASPGDVWTA